MTRYPFIIVVDDDPSVCKALGRLLRTSRMDVQTYASGAALLFALEGRRPDCLVLDIRMPVMTGPELQQRLLDQGLDIPVVFITAHAEDAVTEFQLRSTGVEILHKPFDDQALLDAIYRAMERGSPR
jgi:FixJ family two-component response regulator